MVKDDDLIFSIHENFVISPEDLVIWLGHMEAAVDEVLSDMDVTYAERVRPTLMDWFRSFGAKTVNAENKPVAATGKAGPAAQKKQTERSLALSELAHARVIRHSLRASALGHKLLQRSHNCCSGTLSQWYCV
mmetsp:Transcript_60853/g.132142  ORF Transcript_60853/g.132142 Transcript_60853/m.132142 type:complete len:133 (-) Transcript_60853:220-618(-)